MTFLFPRKSLLNFDTFWYLYGFLFRLFGYFAQHSIVGMQFICIWISISVSLRWKMNNALSWIMGMHQQWTRKKKQICLGRTRFVSFVEDTLVVIVYVWMCGSVDGMRWCASKTIIFLYLSFDDICRICIEWSIHVVYARYPKTIERSFIRLLEL